MAKRCQTFSPSPGPVWFSWACPVDRDGNCFFKSVALNLLCNREKVPDASLEIVLSFLLKNIYLHWGLKGTWKCGSIMRAKFLWLPPVPCI